MLQDAGPFASVQLVMHLIYAQGIRACLSRSLINLWLPISQLCLRCLELCAKLNFDLQTLASALMQAAMS